ncbi:hypothetical protein PAXINDRAFT_13142 [Paxillus involutus ATCC 200175]|uniref:Uncharacterized protein n=1 Tax=Paxillus involutus ATCC 200175 TaxID=664439 RepID=A0A0C9U426_PAXIN|nr:hypothetical protein PAXINDRAFT_13142 [Paxillus involutus ATCC 200175]
MADCDPAFAGHAKVKVEQTSWPPGPSNKSSSLTSPEVGPSALPFPPHARMLRVGGSDLIEHNIMNELLHASATIRIISTLQVIEDARQVEVISRAATVDSQRSQRLGFPFSEAECHEPTVCPDHAMLSSLGLPPLKRLLPYLVPLRFPAVPTTTLFSIPIPILSFVDHEDSKER